jgi:hypothetical protein
MDIDPAAPALVRQGRKALALSELRVRARTVRTPVTGDAPVAVSLTSYGKRLDIVGAAIESIARSSTRPRRFILWVDEPGFDPAAHPLLAGLVRRGLEILPCADLGPHKKNVPYCQQFADDGLGLVTADDDIIYPRGWLAGLVAGAQAHPEEFVGYRAKRVVGTDGELAAYATWPSARVGEVGPQVFLTGGAGVVFPPALQRAIRDAGEGFRETCPRADDVWINAQAVRAGIPARRIDADGRSMLSYPRSQDEALHHDNVAAGGNDIQLAATLTGDDRRLMLGRGTEPEGRKGSPMKQALVLATVGRPDLVRSVLDRLPTLDRIPDEVVLSAPTAADLPQELPEDPPFLLTVVTGVRGLTRQRNAGVAALSADAELVTFLDDDSVPRGDFFVAVEEHFARHPDSSAMTGRVVLEGTEGRPPLTDSEIDAALARSLEETPEPDYERDQFYGCNMVFRRSVVERFVFDERLPLYSWLEDTDVARRILAEGGTIYTDPSVVIAHRKDPSGGRTQHIRFGYSSIANWEHLRRKGSVTWADAPGVARMVAKNAALSIRGADSTTRRARLKGNLLAFADIARGRVTPERIERL